MMGCCCTCTAGSGCVQVLASTAEQLALARQEMAVMRSLQHPNLLPLLAHSITQQRHEGAALQVVYMLFPLYEVGAGQHLVACCWHRWRCRQQCTYLQNVADCTSSAALGSGYLPCSIVHVLKKLQRPLPSLLLPRHAVLQDGSLMDLVSRQHAQRQHLPAQDILQIFLQVRPSPAQSCGDARACAGPSLPGISLKSACVLQVCQGVQAMHRARPPLAHRDIKYAAWLCSCFPSAKESSAVSLCHHCTLYCRPHNILLQQLHKASLASAEGDRVDEETQPMQVSS